MSQPFYEPGNYWGRITSQRLGKTSTGKPQFVLTFLVRGIIDPANPEGELIACQQFERSVFRVLTEKTIPYVLEDLQQLGFEGGSWSLLDQETIGFCSFVDKELGFLCKHEEYEGRILERWSMSRGNTGLQVEPLSEKEMRDLDALYGKQLRGASPTAQAKQAEKTPASINDNQSEEPASASMDIPF